jgi:hypothetical protein
MNTQMRIFVLVVMVMYVIWLCKPKDEVVTLEAQLDTNGVWAVEFKAPDEPCRFLVRMTDEQGNVIEYGPFVFRRGPSSDE